MPKIIGMVLEIIKWVILLGSFSAIGIMADNPVAGYFRFLIFFIVVFIGVFIYNKKKSHKTQVNPQLRNISNKAIGIILVLLSVLTPYLFMKSANFTGMVYVLLGLGIVALIALSIFAIKLINSARDRGILYGALGYLIILAICSVPAIIMMQYDKTYNALGTAYYMAFVVTLFSWWGISLFTHDLSDGQSSIE